jgi:hypothetical protein
MKKMFSLLMVLGLLIGLAATTFAQTPGIKYRQRHQQRRIFRGVGSGEVTKGELRKLEKEQKEIQQDKKEARADGTVSLAERRAIHKEQNRASRHIYRAKHNRRDRN